MHPLVPEGRQKALTRRRRTWEHSRVRHPHPGAYVNGSRPLPALVLCVLAPGCIEYAVGDEDDEYVPPVWVTEHFEQQPAARVDLLFVIDDTASMAEEQEALADGFETFVTSLESSDLSYHVGVVTTEATGQLLGNPWIVTRESADPVGDFARAVAVGTEGTADEAGLAAMVAALTEPLVSGANRGFRRSDAVLHVVVVSDADDHSDGLLDDPSASAQELLEDATGASGLPAMFSAVVGDAGTGCSGDFGDAAPGDTYIDVAQGSGGAVASVCAGDLDGILEKLAGLTLAAPDFVELQQVPYGDQVRVTVDGDRLEDGWTLEGTVVRFDDAPELGTSIEVSYQLAPSEGA